MLNAQVDMNDQIAAGPLPPGVRVGYLDGISFELCVLVAVGGRCVAIGGSRGRLVAVGGRCVAIGGFASGLGGGLGGGLGCCEGE